MLGIAAAALLGCSALTHARNAVWSSAIALWTDAATKSAGKARPHVNAGNAFYDAGEIATACRYYDRARALDPRDPLAQFGQARCLARAGKGPLAISLMQEVAVALPQRPEPLNELGRLQLEAGDMGAARKTFEVLVRRHPDDPGAWWNLALSTYRTGDPRAAVAALARLGDRASGFPEYDRLLGLARLDAGEPRAALPVLERALARWPHDLQVVQALALALSRVGRQDEAIALLQRATQAHPDSSQLANGLGVLLLQRGDPDLAESAFLRALALEPANVEARYNLELTRRLGSEETK